MKMELKAGAKMGRYELLTHMAKGGMADVWLARASGPVGFQKTLVIKTILPHLADDPEFVRMFINEAVVAAQLDHPNIVHIFDLGELDGSYFIAMEYIAGRSLRNVQRELHKSKRVPPPWFVLRSISSACEALYHAHNKRDAGGKPMNLVHRDVSPENIMVSFTGETKVLDFGIAKVSSAVSKTRVGVVKGKYAYMAPEQIETVCDGGPLDARIDIYSLGVVMYELLTGRRPFRGANDLALLRQILSDNPEPPCAFCSWIPEPLSNLVLKAMARAPSKRFSSAAELQNAIEEFLASQGFHPTHLHVAAFMRSLFGEEAAESPPLRLSPPSASESESAVPAPRLADSKEESLAIDVSIVLEDDDGEAGDQQQVILRPEDAGSARKPSQPVRRESSRPARATVKVPPPPKPSVEVLHGALPPSATAGAPRVAAGIPAAAMRQKPPTILPRKSLPPARQPSKLPPAGTTAPTRIPVPAAAQGPFSSIVSRAVLPAPVASVSAASPDAAAVAGARATAAPASAVTVDAGQSRVKQLKPAALSSESGAVAAPGAASSGEPASVVSAATAPSVNTSQAVLSGPALAPLPAQESAAAGVAARPEAGRLLPGEPNPGTLSVPRDDKESGESAPGSSRSDTGAHVWDRLMARVRERKIAETSDEEGPVMESPERMAASDRSDATPVKASESDINDKGDSGPKHLWDVLLERARDERGTAENDAAQQSEVGERQAVRPVSSPDPREQGIPGLKVDLKGARAREAFERGLEKLRSKDLDGALEEWSRAVELEPDNRAYQSNVRMLRKQVAARR